MPLNQFLFTFSVVSSTFLALFHFALALGAPMGDYGWSGRYPGVLPKFARWISGGYALVLLAVAGHYASLAGWLPSLLDHIGQIVSVYLLVAFWAVNLIGNLISKGVNERKRISLVSGALLIATIVLIINNL